MITSKKDLYEYMYQDKIALYRKNAKRPKLFSDDLWKYQIVLRKCEYYQNCSKNILAKLWYKYRLHQLGVKYGLYIPVNVFDKGLSIAHYGTVTINPAARVGENCRIHEGVNIGATDGQTKAARIGKNCFIGSGAKIIGDITIADDVAIGAGAVVIKSITEPGTTWGGVPAKKISNNNSHKNLCRDLFDMSV
ncbi:serine O-acetyltransferase [Bariatricus sp. HCP28S3_A7]|uniref:serine O-acetyltransferase n=1 Tax=Bariatricus sp. HCP28S3_A7 TaxID=3438894 RepID=UPI003F8A47A2